MKEQIIKKVAEMTGVSEEICTKVITALEQVMNKKDGAKDGDKGFLENITDAVSGFFGK